MPMFDRCKECKVLVKMSELGKNGVCLNCMTHAVETKEQAEKVADIESKREAEAEEEAKKVMDVQAASALETTESAEKERVAKEKREADTAAEVANLVAENTFVITKGDVSKTCTTFTEAAEVIGCHPQTVSKAFKKKSKSVGDWAVAYPPADGGGE